MSVVAAALSSSTVRPRLLLRPSSPSFLLTSTSLPPHLFSPAALSHLQFFLTATFCSQILHRHFVTARSLLARQLFVTTSSLKLPALCHRCHRQLLRHQLPPQPPARSFTAVVTASSPPSCRHWRQLFVTAGSLSLPALSPPALCHRQLATYCRVCENAYRGPCLSICILVCLF